jgi:hypothetical protein
LSQSGFVRAGLSPKTEAIDSEFDEPNCVLDTESGRFYFCEKYRKEPMNPIDIEHWPNPPHLARLVTYRHAGEVAE